MTMTKRPDARCFVEELNLPKHFKSLKEAREKSQMIVEANRELNNLYSWQGDTLGSQPPWRSGCEIRAYSKDEMRAHVDAIEQTKGLKAQEAAWEIADLMEKLPQAAGFEYEMVKDADYKASRRYRCQITKILAASGDWQKPVAEDAKIVEKIQETLDQLDEFATTMGRNFPWVAPSGGEPIVESFFKSLRAAKILPENIFASWEAIELGTASNAGAAAGHGKRPRV